MKNKLKLFGVIAVVAIIGYSLVGCGIDSGIDTSGAIKMEFPVLTAKINPNPYNASKYQYQNQTVNGGQQFEAGGTLTVTYDVKSNVNASFEVDVIENVASTSYDWVKLATTFNLPLSAGVRTAGTHTFSITKTSADASGQGNMLAIETNPISPVPVLKFYKFDVKYTAP